MHHLKISETVYNANNVMDFTAHIVNRQFHRFIGRVIRPNTIQRLLSFIMIMYIRKSVKSVNKSSNEGIGES